MGSRVRSAMTAPGAVTESDFQKVFAETKPIQVIFIIVYALYSIVLGAFRQRFN